MGRWIVRGITHAVALAIGFALGVYMLPILTAPPAPEKAALQSAAHGALYSARFKRDLKALAAWRKI